MANSKVDLQKLSDSITDNVESVNDKIQKEFSDLKRKNPEAKRSKRGAMK